MYTKINFSENIWFTSKSSPLFFLASTLSPSGYSATIRIDTFSEFYLFR